MSTDYQASAVSPKPAATVASAPTKPSGGRARQLLRYGGLILFGLLCLTFGAYWNLRPSGQDEDDLPDAGPIPEAALYAINRPHVYAAAELNTVTDEEVVIGVSAGSRHRAYLLRAFRGKPTVHVVNDLVGDQAVSVSFCDRTGCCQVFTEPDQKNPLKLFFGGWKDSQMMLRTEDGAYYQDTLEATRAGEKPFRFSPSRYEKTTWKKWKEAHPDTGIYVGP